MVGWGKALAAALFSLECLGCKAPLSDSLLCEQCRVFPEFVGRLCGRCGSEGVVEDNRCHRCIHKSSGPLLTLAASYQLTPAAQALLFAIKHRSWFALVKDLPPAEVAVCTGLDVILPVPLATSRHIARGFNLSAVLAHQLAKQLEIKFDSEQLQKRICTRPQSILSARERRVNLGGAFKAARGIEGRRVLIVDDVLTTGSTLRACAKACRQAGALEVRGWALFRTNLNFGV